MIGRIASIIIVTLLAGKAEAGSFSRSVRGTSSAQFLKLAVDARGAAMGEAYSTLVDQASAMYWNPAALTSINKISGTFMHAAYLESMYFDYFAIGGRVDKAAFGLSAHYMSAGRLVETDLTGTETGSFTPNDLCLALGGAYAIGDRGLAVGAAGKLVRSKVATTATTFAGDVGLLTPKWLDNGEDSYLQASFVASNVGGKLKFDEESERLPLHFKTGFAYRVKPSWDIAIEEGLPEDDRPYTAFGTEFRPYTSNEEVSRLLQLSLRAGLNTRNFGEIGGMTGITLGVGITYKPFSVDYAFVPVGYFGMVHRLSVSVSMGGSDDKDPSVNGSLLYERKKYRQIKSKKRRPKRKKQRKIEYKKLEESIIIH